MPNGNNGNNNNNNATVLATPNSPNNGTGNGNNAVKNNDPAPNNNAKSQSSAEGTRRVNPKTGKTKSKAQIQAAVMMKRAKETLNGALGIKSTASEFNPLVKIIKRENFSNANAKKAAVNAYVEEIRKKREAKVATGTKKVKAVPAVNTTASNKPKRKYVRKAKVANKNTANVTPANVGPVNVGAANDDDPVGANTVVASEEKVKEKKPKRKVENPSAAQSQYKTNMQAAKKLLNNTLSIKSMPPEHNPLVGIMRKEYGSQAEKQAAIDAHIKIIRNARAEKASKKATKGGSRTRKNRRTCL